MSRLSIFLSVLMLVAISEALLVLPSTTSSTCRYWCKKKISGRAYCCEDEMENGSEKSGMCPPVRDSCPQAFRPSSRPPAQCDRDNECRGADKCCYDICLKHRTCKPSQIAVTPLNNDRNRRAHN